MKCFYHHDRDALGTCKACGKGLCDDCLEDFGKGLACRDRCEEHVRRLIALIDHNLRVAPAARSTMRANRAVFLGLAVFVFIAGAFFTVLALTDSRIWFIAIIGGVLVAFSVFLFIKAWQMPHRFEDPDARR
jgi:hypothetical protein